MDQQRTVELSQEGMTIALTRFAEFLKGGGQAFNTMVVPEFVRCNFEENTMVYRYKLEPWMANPGGAVHGGIVATLVDTTMGSLSYYVAGGKLTPTISMKVDYVMPGLMNKPYVYVGCKCTRCGRTMGYLTAKAWQDDENKPFTTADGVYFTGGEYLQL